MMSIKKKLKRLALLLAAIALVSITFAAPASAAKPEKIVDEIDVVVFDVEASEICGLPLEGEFVGTVTTTLYFTDDVPGPDVARQHFRIRSTWTNLDTGTSLSTQGLFNTAHVEIGGADDGRNLVRLTGLQGHVVIPGEGVSVQDSGQVVFAGFPGTDRTIISEVGRLSGGLFPAACSLLQ